MVNSIFKANVFKDLLKADKLHVSQISKGFCFFHLVFTAPSFCIPIRHKV